MQSMVVPSVCMVASLASESYFLAIAGAVAAVETAVAMKSAVAVCVETSIPIHLKRPSINAVMHGVNKSLIAAVGYKFFS